MDQEIENLVSQMRGVGISYSDAVRQFKKCFIVDVLSDHKGNQREAAEELKMHRNMLSRLLAELR